MHYFLTSFILTDNGHEHIYLAIFEGDTLEDARVKASEQEYSAEIERDEMDESIFGFGDGETTCMIEHMREITMGEASFCQNVGIAYIY